MPGGLGSCVSGPVTPWVLSVCQVLTRGLPKLFYLFYHRIIVLYLTFCTTTTCRFFPSFPPRLWLHRLQQVRVFSITSWPPSACGMMWSTSALFGLPEYSQSIAIPQSGQFVKPLSRSILRRWSLVRIHCAVPVRDELGRITVTFLLNG